MLYTVSPVHILHYNVHKLSKYKTMFLYIIKEFVCYIQCLLTHILHYNVHKVQNAVCVHYKGVCVLCCGCPPHILHYKVHKLSKYKRQFVYIIKEFVWYVLSHPAHTPL